MMNLLTSPGRENDLSEAFTLEAGDKTAAASRRDTRAERDFQQQIDYALEMADGLAFMGRGPRRAEEASLDRLFVSLLAAGNGLLTARFNAELQEIIDLENTYAEPRLHPLRPLSCEDPDERHEHWRKMREMAQKPLKPALEPKPAGGPPAAF